MSPMIVLAGTAEFATRAGRDEGVAASAPFQAPARNDEPGCLDIRDSMVKYGVVSAKFKKDRVDHSEPVYDGTGTPRADFFSLTV